VTPTTDGSFTTAQVGRNTIRFSIDGEGPPLLLVMGLGGSIEMWGPFRAALDGFRTIAFDVPGTGGSPATPWPQTMRSYASVATDLLDHLGVDRAAVLGYSFGGMVAQELVLRAPDRVTRLVLAATTAGFPAVPPQPLNIMRMFSPLRYYSASYYRAVAPTLFGGRTARNPALLDAEFEHRHTAPPSLLGYIWQTAAAMQWSAVHRDRRIHQPTLILAGDDDRLVPVANARVLQSLIQGSQLEIVHGAGHLLLIDQTDDTVPIIEDFLRVKSGGAQERRATRPDADAAAGDSIDPDTPARCG
jgi:pimeloyl-ACP methyl ester carboxylesterase